MSYVCPNPDCQKSHPPGVQCEQGKQENNFQKTIKDTPERWPIRFASRVIGPSKKEKENGAKDK